MTTRAAEEGGDVIRAWLAAGGRLVTPDQVSMK
jgi:hypothetical protein